MLPHRWMPLIARAEIHKNHSTSDTRGGYGASIRINRGSRGASMRARGGRNKRGNAHLDLIQRFHARATPLLSLVGAKMRPKNPIREASEEGRMRARVGDESLTSPRGAAPRVQLGAMATGCEGLGGGITGRCKREDGE